MSEPTLEYLQGGVKLTVHELALLDDCEHIQSGEIFDAEIPDSHETAIVSSLTIKQASLVLAVRNGMRYVEKLVVDGGQPVEALVRVLTPGGRVAHRKVRFGALR